MFCFSQTAASPFSSSVLSDPCLFHVRLVITTHSYLEISLFMPLYIFFFFYIYHFICGLISLCTPGPQIYISTFHVPSVARGADLNVARL